TGFLNKNTQLRAYVSFKELRTLEISGASNIKIDGSWKGRDAKILLSGASDIKGDLALDYLQFKQSGASNAKLSGKVGSLDLHVSGASDFKGYDLITDSGKVEATGASDVQITANKSLSITASGASDVKFKGAVNYVPIRSTGASSVERVER
ncbi:MAG: GIN domain-containing protein, partial [Chitinophagaceae bacterium]